MVFELIGRFGVHFVGSENFRISRAAVQRNTLQIKGECLFIVFFRALLDKILSWIQTEWLRYHNASQLFHWEQAYVCREHGIQGHYRRELNKSVNAASCVALFIMFACAERRVNRGAADGVVRLCRLNA